MTLPLPHPSWALVYAAGHGKRMMPLTATQPKPMLPVAGKPLLAHALDKIAAAGVPNVAVNTHHCAQVAEDYLHTRTGAPRLHISHEDTLLETGGGTKNALDKAILATSAPFLAVNADTLWTDGPKGLAIHRLWQTWQALGDAPDVLLLLVPRTTAWGHDSDKGDYAFASTAAEGTGRLVRLSNKDAPYIYAGLQIVRPQLYADTRFGTAFSNLKIFDDAQEKGRLFGVVHDGGWYHFSTPESLDRFAREVTL